MPFEIYLIVWISQKSTLSLCFIAGDGCGPNPDELHPSFEHRGGAAHHHSLPQHTGVGSRAWPAAWIQSCELQGLDGGEDPGRRPPGTARSQRRLLGEFCCFSKISTRGCLRKMERCKLFNFSSTFKYLKYFGLIKGASHIVTHVSALWTSLQFGKWSGTLVPIWDAV